MSTDDDDRYEAASNDADGDVRATLAEVAGDLLRVHLLMSGYLSMLPDSVRGLAVTQLGKLDGSVQVLREVIGRFDGRG